ncbi:MAG: type II toxin-antitoxin system Phd/YefM family antitoxin [Firmicutes bacterium]|nr:type II toxin-antitoxin system Phd/YefM family antitoxin [Bacillota bacterium]
MHIISITELRQDASKVLKLAASSKEPVLIVQRSNPVAYLIDAETFDKLKQQPEDPFITSKKALAGLAGLRNQMATRGRQPDSVTLLRQLREGRVR